MGGSLGLKIALAASVALNLFIAGLTIGAFVGHADAARRLPPPNRPGVNLWIAAAALPPAQRDAFREVLRERARLVAPELREAREARRAAAALIAAPNYDAAGAAAALARARAGEVKVRGEVDAALLDFVGKLPPQDRRSMADAVVRGRLGPPDRLGRPGGGPHGVGPNPTGMGPGT